MADNIANKRLAVSLRRKAETISFLHSLMSGPFHSLDEEEVPPWFEAGKVQQISDTVYSYHTECRQRLFFRLSPKSWLTLSMISMLAS